MLPREAACQPAYSGLHQGLQGPAGQLSSVPGEETYPAEAAVVLLHMHRS